MQQHGGLEHWAGNLWKQLKVIDQRGCICMVREEKREAALPDT